MTANVLDIAEDGDFKHNLSRPSGKSSIELRMLNLAQPVPPKREMSNRSRSAPLPEESGQVLAIPCPCCTTQIYNNKLNPQKDY
ncbi:MAG: hypothetical protein JSS64_05600 [Bacteroidetes bacterium]|nr:hypothetical protein [Bacteroidota bacterium]